MIRVKQRAIYLNDQQWAFVQSIADDNHLTASEWIRAWIDKAMKKGAK